ncbi:MAG: hypothetical protein JWQ98_2246 [Chlorobi bacterium]|nr:hypothetical protein [Chlorobiota bacterium]
MRIMHRRILIAHGERIAGLMGCLCLLIALESRQDLRAQTATAATTTASTAAGTSSKDASSADVKTSATGSGLKPEYEIQVDVHQGRFMGNLPFDVSYALWTEVDPAVSRFEVRYIPIAEGEVVEENDRRWDAAPAYYWRRLDIEASTALLIPAPILAPPAAPVPVPAAPRKTVTTTDRTINRTKVTATGKETEDSRDTKIETKDEPPVPAAAAASGAVTAAATPSTKEPEPKAKEHAYVMMPPLDPQHYYAFRFTMIVQPSDRQIATFQARVRQILSFYLAQIRILLTEPDVLLLRTALNQEILGLLATGQKVSDPMFDPAISYAQFQTEWGAPITAILNAQASHALFETQNMPKDSVAFKKNIDNIAASNELKTLISRATTLRASDGAMAKQYDTSGRGLEIADLNSTRRELLASGRESFATITDVPMPDELAVIRKRQAVYREYDYRLTLLRSFLDFTASKYPNLVSATEQAAVDALRDPAGDIVGAQTAIKYLIADLDQLHDAIIARNNALDALVARARYAGVVNQAFQSSTIGTYDLFRNWYVGTDVGFVWAPAIGSMLPYIGTNIYLQPINKDASLTQRGSLGYRFAFTVGATIGRVRDLPSANTSFLFDRALMLGAGFRLTQSIRIGGGVLLFREQNKSPLISGTMVSATPYTAMSLDINLNDFSFRTLFTPFQ